MAKRETRRQKLNWIVIVIACVTIAFLILISAEEKNGADFSLAEYPYLDFIHSLFADTHEAEESDKSISEIDAALKVHFIDVGQGKAILIEAPEQNVLIDAGENGQGQKVLRYLSSNSVSTLDIVMGTHPHSDHIGGLDDVINGMDVKTVVMPVVPDALVPSGATYTDLLTAIADKKLKIKPAKPGEVFDLGGGAELTILGPIKSETADLNDMSIVSRLDYGEVSFLFTGDATAYEERDLLDAERNLSADILDVGHHGSSTSSSLLFLQTVSPRLAVVSCGLDNQYNHPNRDVMERIALQKAQVLRTDLNGTVVVATDGVDFAAEKER